MIGGIVQALSGLATSYIDGSDCNPESKRRDQTKASNW